MPIGIYIKNLIVKPIKTQCALLYMKGSGHFL